MEENVRIGMPPQMQQDCAPAGHTPPISVPQTINIKPCLRGYIVCVGCQQVAFETREKMLSEIKRYLKNPAQVEKEYLEKK